MATKVKSAACLRISNDEGGESTSPNDQLSEIRKLAANENAEIGDANIYNDEHVSGDWHEKRDDLKKMIADAAVGEFERVYLWAQDRFSRADSIEAFAWFQRVRETGVEVRLLEDGESLDFADPTVRMKLFMRAEAAHAKVVSTSKDTIRGQRAKAGIGRKAGKIPTGYLRPAGGGHLFPHPMQAEPITALFDLCANEATNSDMQTHLRLHDIRLTMKAVRELLKNRAYLGEVNFGKSTGSKYAHGVKKGKRKKLPRDQWVITPQAHLPLVTPEIFDRVQQVLASRSGGAGPKSNHEYALSGLVHCPQCGQVMHGLTERGTRKYECSGNREQKLDNDCPRWVVREDELLKVALEQLRDRVTPAIERAIEVERRWSDKSYADEIGQPHDLNAKARVQWQESIDEVDSRIERARTNLASVSPEFVYDVEESIRGMMTEREEYVRQLEKVADSETAFARFHRWRQEAKRFDRAWETIRNYAEFAANEEYDPSAMRRGLASMGLLVTPELDRVPYGKKHRCVLIGGSIEVTLPGVSVDLAQSIVPWLSPASLDAKLPNEPVLPAEVVEAARLFDSANNKDSEVQRIGTLMVVDSP